MSRQEIKAESVPIVEQLQALSKEELVELVTGTWLWGRLAERDITDAKAAVVRKKAEVAWREYEAFDDSPALGDHRSLDRDIEWTKRIKEKDALYKKYEKLWKKADKIQYGR